MQLSAATLGHPDSHLTESREVYDIIFEQSEKLSDDNAYSTARSHETVPSLLDVFVYRRAHVAASIIMISKLAMQPNYWFASTSNQIMLPSLMQAQACPRAWDSGAAPTPRPPNPLRQAQDQACAHIRLGTNNIHSAQAQNLQEAFGSLSSICWNLFMSLFKRHRTK